MNLVLFGEQEDATALPAGDARCQHLVGVLRVAPGHVVDVGRIGGPLGRARVEEVGPAGLRFTVHWLDEADPGLAPCGGATLLLGCPRPIEGRRILEDAVGLGFSRVILCRSGRVDPHYLRASQYQPEAIREALLRGAAQAFTTRVPVVELAPDLRAAFASFDEMTPGLSRIALDVYEGSAPLAPDDRGADGRGTVLAIGPERGWDDADRSSFRAAGFALRHLGAGVLRTPVAIAVAAGRLGLGGARPHLDHLASLRALNRR